MNIKSVSGLTYYVSDLDKSAEFYETLGFRFGKRDEESLTVYLNWFSIRLVAIDKEQKAEFQKQANSDNKGAGLFINIKIVNADESYKNAIEKGLKPVDEPRDWPWGNREFVIRDPDGYKLVFFQKL